jgi:hypothetical protein
MDLYLPHNPHLRLTQAENQAARQAADRFIKACADYRALLASQGLPLVADLAQLEECCGAHSELFNGLLLALTELELDRLLSRKHWPNGLPRLSLLELASHYDLDYGRLLDAYTPKAA